MRQSALPASMSLENERRLISFARRGDRPAFDRLAAGYREALHGFVTLRVGIDAADDVLQETWMACWLSIAKYSGRSRFKAWLYGIAVNKCADHLRRSSAARSSALDEMEDLPDPRCAERAILLREAVRGSLGRLQDKQREVVELYYYAELTLPEIAEALRRNLNTVKYQFYRAHDEVARELRAEGA